MNPRTLEGWVHQALMPGGSSPAPEARARAEQAVRSLDALGVRAIPADDPAYPTALRDLPDPPSVVFVRGAALPAVDRAVAIVGARAATPYGAGLATRLATDLARLGVVVVSGLARGIDAAAHRGALAAEGVTVAVLPSGLDCVTPSHHQDLAEQIVAGAGTLMTELAAGGPRFKGEFVKRNRLIAGLCAATIVVEAAEGSGALHTAAFARALGRAVLAVPGDVDRPASRGAHALLREGARMCEDAGDVMRAISEWRVSHGGSSAICGPEERLLEMLGSEGLLAEDLAARAGLDLPQTLAALLSLQWAGLAAPLPGQRWARVRR